jgi:hypothetical protein
MDLINLKNKLKIENLFKIFKIKILPNNKNSNNKIFYKPLEILMIKYKLKWSLFLKIFKDYMAMLLELAIA